MQIKKIIPRLLDILPPFVVDRTSLVDPVRYRAIEGKSIAVVVVEDWAGAAA